MEKKENLEHGKTGGSLADGYNKRLKDTSAWVKKQTAKESPKLSPVKTVLLGLLGLVYLFMLLSIGLQGGWPGLGIAWAALFVVAIIGGFIGGLMNIFWIEAPRIGILAVLFSLLWLLEFKIGAYNLWRDFIALLAALIVTIVLYRWVLPRLPKWFNRYRLLLESAHERAGVRRAGVTPATTETTRTEQIEDETPGKNQPESQKTDEETSEKQQPECQEANAGQTGKKQGQTLVFAGRVLLFFIIGWSFISVSDDFFEHPVFYPEEPHQLTADMPSPDPNKARVALALSGGGYRAALLHAGVLSALEERKLPVVIKAMSTVSGGSIIGSFYATGGTPEQFLKAVVDRRFNLKREILHIHVLSHLLLASRIIGTEWNLIWFLDDFNRTHAQARLLDRLFLKDMIFSEGLKRERPELMLCMTDLAGGALIGITPKGAVRQPIGLPLSRIDFVNYPNGVSLQTRVAPTFDPIAADTFARLEKEKLSSLVAASGAFPGAFKAYSPGADEDKSQPKNDTPLLSDGGILDNYGIILLYAAKKLASDARPNTAGPDKKANLLEAWDVDIVIVSDGSAIAEDKQPRFSVGELMRAVDVMSAAAANQEILDTYFPFKNSKPPAIALTPRNLCPGQDPGSPASESEESCLRSLIASELLALEALENIVTNITDADKEQKQARTWLDIARKSGRSSPAAKKEEGKALEAIKEEFHNRRKAFVETSTLDDQIDEQHARSIFLLGKYLVYLNESYIRLQAKNSRLSSNHTRPKTTDQ